jgi:hypothetical protein
MKIVRSNTPSDETFIVRFISSDKIETVQEPTSDKTLLLTGLNDDQGKRIAILRLGYSTAQTNQSLPVQ